MMPSTSTPDQVSNEPKCPDCDGRGDVMVRGLPGDAWPEVCRRCDGAGKLKAPTWAGYPLTWGDEG